MVARRPLQPETWVQFLEPQPARISCFQFLRRGGIEQAATPVIDISSLVTSLTSAVSASDVLVLIGTVVTACMGFVLIWMGARKLIREFQNAIRSGKIRL